MTVFILSIAVYAYAESYGRYGLNTNDNTGNIVNYIIEENNKLAKKSTTVFLVGEYINHIMEFEDLEKDYLNISLENKLKDNKSLSKDLKIPKELFAKYEHDPSVFDNPVPKNSRDNGKFNLISSIKDPYIISKAEFNMRGSWKLTIKGSDDTKNLNWDKESEEKSLSFTIHAKPTASIEYWKQPIDTDTVLYLSSENSFDIDFEYSLPNNGIIKYIWEYQLEDGSWHNYLETTTEKRLVVPKTIGSQKITNYALTVYDFHGATDTVLTSVAPPKLMEPEAIIVAPESIYVGPHGSDVLTVNNDSEPKANIKSYQYTFNFKSVSSFMNTTQNTVASVPSYTFAKNTLKYSGGSNIFDRTVKLKVTSLTNNTSEATKAIQVVPVVINELSTTSINASMVTFKADTINANPTDHRLVATVKGVDYVMTHKGSQRWEVDVNITGADRLYARVEKKTDPNIVYHRKDIIANRPPTIEIITFSPKHMYEGDNAKAVIQVSDPDVENLMVEFKLYREGTLINTWNKNVSPTGSTYLPFTENIRNKIEVINGSTTKYSLFVKVIDNLGEFDTDEKSFNVYPLSVTGYVKHTEDWEKNRKSYNISVSGNHNSPRTPEIFFPGEKFILEADSTIIEPERIAEDNLHAVKVTVKIEGTSYNTSLDSINTVNWHGDLWDKAMLNWGDNELDFVFEVEYSNGTIKHYNLNPKIKIVDDKYWRLHRKH